MGAKKVMLRMISSCGFEFLGACFQCWKNVVTETRLERERETQDKALHQKFGQLHEGAKGNVKGIISKMMQSSAAGKMFAVIQAWAQYVVDERAARALGAQLSKCSSQLQSFGDRNAKHAGSAMERAFYHIKMTLMLRCFCCWRLDSKIGRIL